MSKTSLIWPGVPLALASAVLFGASTPAAKLLLGSISPWMLAGLLYLGSGLGLGLFALIRHFTQEHPPEASLTRRDLPWLAAVIGAGGIAAPVLLMIGLSQVAAASASLLLNLEGLATMAIAWLAFHEPLDRRLFAGAVAILLGAALLKFQSGAQHFGVGSLAIAGACLCWGIDNNLTRKLSFSDPVHLTSIKGFVAGLTNLTLALLTHPAIPPIPATLGALVTGLLGYGVSLVLFTLALRHLGTARSAAYFSTAPFIGSIIAVAVLHDPVSAGFWAAALLMAGGVAIHLLESHEHEHEHLEQNHSHRHVHDAHHRHGHSPLDPPGEPHTHAHDHAHMVHAHAHMPDLHHRHRHKT